MIERKRFFPFKFFSFLVFFVGFLLAMSELIHLNFEISKLKIEKIKLEETIKELRK